LAEIRPFRGVRYNTVLIKDLSRVICPPYDIISPQLQQELYQRSEYNFVRVEYNQPLSQDRTTADKYARVAAIMEQWLKQGILQADALPAIYLHDHYFHYQGKEHKRRGIIACVRLEEWEKGVVRPHEGTLAAPRSDRINLLRALQANTSPILAMFEDKGQRISSLLASQAKNKPIISMSHVDGESHRLWAITDQHTIAQICADLVKQPIYIADGHHRYESALFYKKERLAQPPAASEDEAFHFVMMTLVDFTDPGLMALPPHHLLCGIPESTLDGLRTKLESLFAIKERPRDMPGIWQRVENLFTETDEPGLVLFGLSGERFLVLRLRDFATASRMIPGVHSELYKKLDVSIVDHLILEKLLGFGNGGQIALSYTYDRKDAVSRVLNQECQLVFLLRPVKVSIIKAVADAGDRMPRKSTYFYPKAPAGLVFYSFTTLAE